MQINYNYITPVGGRPVHRLSEDSLILQVLLYLCTGRPPIGVMIPDAV